MAGKRIGGRSEVFLLFARVILAIVSAYHHSEQPPNP